MTFSVDQMRARLAALRQRQVALGSPLYRPPLASSPAASDDPRALLLAPGANYSIPGWQNRTPPRNANERSEPARSAAAGRLALPQTVTEQSSMPAGSVADMLQAAARLPTSNLLNLGTAALGGHLNSAAALAYETGQLAPLLRAASLAEQFGAPGNVPGMLELAGAFPPGSAGAGTGVAAGLESMLTGPTGIFGAAAPIALPALAFIGFGLAQRALEKPSVGASISVRFGRGDEGLRVRRIGADNGVDRIMRETFAEYSRGVMSDALARAGAAATDILDGSLVYFPNPVVNQGQGAYGANVAGETRYYATPTEAMQAYLLGQMAQGRIRGRAGSLMSSLQSVAAERPALEALAQERYLARAGELLPSILTGVEGEWDPTRRWVSDLLGKAQTAFLPPGAEPRSVPDLLGRTPATGFMPP